MKAAQINRYGGSEVIEINQNASLPPKPLQGKILVSIKAAGVNPVDWKIREGHMQQMMHLQFPSTLGMDFSGVIQQIGGNDDDDGGGGEGLAEEAETAVGAAKNLKQGDEVYGRLQHQVAAPGHLQKWSLQRQTVWHPNQKA